MVSPDRPCDLNSAADLHNAPAEIVFPERRSLLQRASGNTVFLVIAVITSMTSLYTKGIHPMSRVIGLICLCLSLAVCGGCGVPEGGSGTQASAAE